MLVHQWAITQCMDVFSCTANMTETTLHGMWPSVQGKKTYPCDCTSEQFNPNLLNSTLLTEMEKYWPTLSTNTNDYFWGHEWSKHGTCALDVVGSQPGYFSDALALREKYDIVAALTAAGFPPSNDKGFTLTQMNDALAAAYGSNVLARVSCDANGNIQELVVCFDKQLQPLACAIAASPGGCKQASTRTLYLPATMTTA
jgi:ribonuclease T2